MSGKTDDEAGKPWAEYRRDRLPRGWTHLLGRDVIEGALRDADAQIDSLSLGRPDLPHRAQDHQIFDVYYYGDSLPGFPTAPGTRSSLLRMWWTAVPVEIAPAIIDEVRRHWLPQGCAWAATALSYGNAWSASEHRWRLEHHPASGLHVIES